ncbi:MAG: GIY-YIG nuclease family protein [Defluviitaleaceae bacterium]|nr:GIY-YIG nuclease family protein [Defluviitaleaceae bacterium]
MPAYVYFMANKTNNVLYVGVTSNLLRRVWEHKSQANRDCFTAKYKCTKLVFFEETSCIKSAIMREKQLKDWMRSWKNALISEHNPTWLDLSLTWYDSLEIADQVRNDGL